MICIIWFRYRMRWIGIWWRLEYGHNLHDKRSNPLPYEVYRSQGSQESQPHIYSLSLYVPLHLHISLGPPSSQERWTLLWCIYEALVGSYNLFLYSKISKRGRERERGGKEAHIAISCPTCKAGAMQLHWTCKAPYLNPLLVHQYFHPLH